MQGLTALDIAMTIEDSMRRAECVHAVLEPDDLHRIVEADEYADVVFKACVASRHAFQQATERPLIGPGQSPVQSRARELRAYCISQATAPRASPGCAVLAAP